MQVMLIPHMKHAMRAACLMRTLLLPHQCYYCHMSGLESASRGEELYKKFTAETHEAIALTDPRVQIALAKLAYPNEAKPMEKWIMGDEATGMPPLSDPFRSYIEAHPGSIALYDEQALSQLLSAIRADSSETFH